MSFLAGGLLVVIVLAVISFVAGAASFISWKRRTVALSRRRSEVAETTGGAVEFTRAGEGPVILHFHAGAAGCDQTLALSWDFHEAGYEVVTPSRPGYLRTPLTTGAKPEQAADSIAALLDLLVIDRVCVMGTSGGGPTALQFALRHPGRTMCLVLQSAISRQFVEPRRSTHSLIGRVVFSRGKLLADLGAWCAHWAKRLWPSPLIRSLLAASDDLDRARARERRSFVMGHAEQLEFFRRLVESGMPLSTRQAGLKNDLHQFAELPIYPLERITCPTLVVHGRADGNVPFAHAEFVAIAVPKAELLAIEDCGHFIWVGPGAEHCRERVTAFLGRHALRLQS